MPPDPKRKALADAQRAQAKFEKTQEQIDRERESRRASFTRARDAGATLREIGESVGLHWTRVREIVSGR
jgi:DNA-directed RNA polymerase sigma subunit (sigma70/sigma32)